MKPSAPAKLFRAVIRPLANVNPVIVKEKNKNLVKDLRSMETMFPNYHAPKGYKFEKIDLDGLPVEVFSKIQNPSDKVILVLHGGAYISRMMFYYRLKNKRYSEACEGGTVIHYDYHCAPEYKYPTQLEETMRVWNWLTQVKGVKEENIITVGDSAGGHLNMSLLMKLHDEGRKMPKAAVFLSPWLDMSASGESYVENYKNDPLFGIKGQKPGPEEVKELLASSEIFMWFGDQDRMDPYISPVYAEIDNTYPEILVTVGGYEMLLSDSKTLVKKFRDAGIEARLHIEPGMFHVYNMYEVFPESQRALKLVNNYIHEKFFGYTT